MNKTLLAVAVVVSFAGNTFAADKALSSLESASLSRITEIAVPGAASAEAAGTEFSNKAADVLAPLTAAVNAAQKKELVEMGYYFSLTTYPANTSVKKILADVRDTSESEIGEGLFKMSSGDASVKAFVKYLNDEAKYEMADSNSMESAIRAKGIRAVADAAGKAFIGTSRFTEVQLASHNRYEDGDFDNQVLIAKEKDGTFRVLAYTRNPY